MGSSRISNALATLSKGLMIIGANREERDRLEENRQFQRERDDARNAFTERLQNMSMTHAKEMQTSSFEHAETMQGNSQEFQKSMFESEQAAVNARHAQSLAAEYARIRQSAAAQGAANARADAAQADAKADRDLQRKLKVYELKINQGQTQYNSAIEAMGKELGKLAEQPMLAADSTGKKMAAARASIEKQYAPMLTTAKAELEESIDLYAKAVGAKADFSDTVGKVSMSEGGDTLAGGDKVSAAVEAAKAQIGSGPMPPESHLIAGFKKYGLSQSEAMAAARRVRSGTAK